MLGVMAVLLVVSQYRRPPPHSQALESWQASSATFHEADITDSESMCSSTDFKHVLVCAVHGPSSTTLYRSRRSARTSQQVLGRPVGPAYLVLNSTIAGLSLWADRHRGSGGALGVSPACVDDQLALVVPARPAAGRRPTQVWSPCLSAVVGSVRGLPVCDRGGLDLSSKEARPTAPAASTHPPSDCLSLRFDARPRLPGAEVIDLLPDQRYAFWLLQPGEYLCTYNWSHGREPRCEPAMLPPSSLK